MNKSAVSQTREWLESSTERLLVLAEQVEQFIKASLTAYNNTYLENGSPHCLVVHTLVYDNTTKGYKRTVGSMTMTNTNDKVLSVAKIVQVMLRGKNNMYPVAYVITAEAYYSMYDQDSDKDIIGKIKVSEDPLRKEAIVHSCQSIIGKGDVLVYDIKREVEGDENSKPIALDCSTLPNGNGEISGIMAELFTRAVEIEGEMLDKGIRFDKINFD